MQVRLAVEQLAALQLHRYVMDSHLPHQVTSPLQHLLLPFRLADDGVRAQGHHAAQSLAHPRSQRHGRPETAPTALRAALIGVSLSRPLHRARANRRLSDAQNASRDMQNASGDISHGECLTTH